MGPSSRHVSTDIARPASEVYEFAADPLNLPRWAAGLAGATVEPEADHWVTESALGRVTFTFLTVTGARRASPCVVVPA